MLAVIGSFAFAPSALAQEDSADKVYSGEGGGTQQIVDPGGTGEVSDPGDPGALPFSGLDLGLMLGGAVVLVGTGAGVSRLVSQRSPA